MQLNKYYIYKKDKQNTIVKCVQITKIRHYILEDLTDTHFMKYEFKIITEHTTQKNTQNIVLTSNEIKKYIKQQSYIKKITDL